MQSKQFSKETHCNILTDEFIIDEFFSSFLSNDYLADVHMKDLNNTRKKILKLLSGGSQRLRVVSDFDRTMSKYRHNNELVPICHDLFGSKSNLPEAAKNKLELLYDKYLPIEIDPTMAVSEKIPQMAEWWRLGHEVIASCGVHREVLAAMVKESGIILREGLREFVELLRNHDVPILIFSAGLGDVIRMLLNYSNIESGNITIISNFMCFDEEDMIVGFHDPLIHSFNKTADIITSSRYFDLSIQRPNVLLFGDSVGDVDMAGSETRDNHTGVTSTVLRVGFLNDEIGASLETFKRLYDIVIVNDDTFHIPVKIVQTILRTN